MQKAIRKGSPQAKARMKAVRSQIGKSKPKPKKLQLVSFKAKKKIISFKARI